MAQFDVHRNLGRNRRIIPLLLVVQSARFNYLHTRLSIPLVIPSQSELRDGRLVAEIMGRPFTMLSSEMFAAPLRVLGPVAGSLKDEDFRILQAIDDIITTAYG